MIMKIALIVNEDKKRAFEVASQAAALLTSAGAEIYTSGNCRIDGAICAGTAQEVIRDTDITVTVGGDGTIIHNAKFAALYKKPLLGINLGRIGFVAKPLLGINLGRIGFVANIEPDELSELSKLLTGDYRIQSRMLLEITVDKDGAESRYTAVNEVVLHRDTLANLIDISVELGEERMISYRADGMLFSTPTGSTAYSFSAGGPVIEPDMRCILLNPICPHALSTRPVVFGEDSVLRARVWPSSTFKCYLTVDGQYHIPISSDDTVTVKKSPLELSLVILKEKNFYKLLSEKLKEF